MADVLTTKYKELLLAAGLNLATSDIRVMLVKSAYIFNAAHDFLDDVTGANDNGRSASLGSKIITDGVFDAADTTLTATAAAACNAIIVFFHTGNDATARILAYIDFAAFTPAVSQVVNIQFNASGIFSL